MKDAIILALLLALAVIGFGQSHDPQPAIQDTTLLHRADFPVCVTVHNGPLQPRWRPTDLYPRRSDAA